MNTILGISHYAKHFRTHQSGGLHNKRNDIAIFRATIPLDSRETTNLMLAGSCVYSQGGHHMHDKSVFAGENSGFANCTFNKWHGF